MMFFQRKSAPQALRGGLLAAALLFAVAAAPATSAPAVEPGASHPGGGSASSFSCMASGRGANATDKAWSGAVYRGANFSSISAQWVVPTLSCDSSSFQSSYTWLGLGGWNQDKALEQLGTAKWCKSGKAYYGLFAEFWQNPPIAGDGGVYPGYPVSPGDTMTASVTKLANGQYRIKETSSRGWTYTKDGNAPGSYQGNLSAEVVHETPTESTGVADLPKSNDVNFSNIAYQADASASTTLIDMVDGSGNKRDLTTSTGSASINIKWLAH